MRLLEVRSALKMAQRLEYQRTLWSAQTGMPLKFGAKTFDNFDAQGNERRVGAIRQYAQEFPLDKRPTAHPSLLITGRTNGIGKTHLAVAVLRTLIDRYDNLERETCPFLFVTADALKRRVQDAQRFNNPENLDQVFKALASPWLLVVDDLGKERSLTGADAAATQAMYYSLINERYNAELPMLVTSNLSFEPWSPHEPSLADLIGLAGISRLREMCGGVEYAIEGQDRR